MHKASTEEQVFVLFGTSRVDLAGLLNFVFSSACGEFVCECASVLSEAARVSG